MNPAPNTTSLTAVLLDRDGTVIEDRHYLADPEGVTLLPGAGQGLAALAAAGARLFLVTNQSGIGRGYFTEADLHACNDRLGKLLGEYGVTLTGTAFCPHGPDDGCACRKPAPGMWLALRDRHGLCAAATAMVGDKPEDVAFGRSAGLGLVVLVLTGKGQAAARTLGVPVPEGDAPVREPDPADLAARPDWPHAVARDLAAAAAWLLGRGTVRERDVSNSSGSSGAPGASGASGTPGSSPCAPLPTDLSRSEPS
ncbi:D-glycero-alpha-D-manno-heptose-1,7-bisphosphate 7-phosphatase [Nitratidesulfovibrio sp. D1]|uniref:D-glycero-alpha-D-manno-heptose-1,7-bisphosphate 7-phosphatase n=1 Tax=Nitratidesulfovibrio sp. D1 TaxID=3440151 RepID=UPI003EBD2B69